MALLSGCIGIIIILLIHATYGDFEILICIDDLSVYSGSLPARAFGLVMEWASGHQTELIENWKFLKSNMAPKK